MGTFLKKMKNLCSLSCKGSELSTTIAQIHRLFEPKTTRLIVNTRENDQEKSYCDYLYSFNFITLSENHGHDSTFVFEILSNSICDTAHRMNTVDWNRSMRLLEDVQKKIQDDVGLKNDIANAARELKNAIVFCGERYFVSSMIQKKPKPTFHFNATFRHPIPPMYIPLVLLECSSQIKKIVQWSPNSSIYQFQTHFGSLFDIHSRGISDATIFSFDFENGLSAPYQLNQYDIPHAAKEWISRILHDKKEEFPF